VTEILRPVRRIAAAPAAAILRGIAQEMRRDSVGGPRLESKSSTASTLRRNGTHLADGFADAGFVHGFLLMIAHPRGRVTAASQN